MLPRIHIPFTLRESRFPLDLRFWLAHLVFPLQRGRRHGRLRLPEPAQHVWRPGGVDQRLLGRDTRCSVRA